MPSDPSFRQRVLAGETLLGTFLMMGSPVATELAARSGLDWVLIDLEHGLAGESDLLGLLQAVQGTGATPIVRVERTERLRVGRALDMGAMGIMAPQVSGVEEARSFASYLRYQPAGQRGIMVFSRGLDWGAGGHGSVKEPPRGADGHRPDRDARRRGRGRGDGRHRRGGRAVRGPGGPEPRDGDAREHHRPRVRGGLRKVADAAHGAGKAAGMMLWKPDDAARFRDVGYTSSRCPTRARSSTPRCSGFVDGTRKNLGQ